VIAAIVSAHNDEAHLADCLRAVREASRRRRLGGEAVLRVVVLDACTDSSARISREAGAHTLSLQARNMGAARALGAQWAIEGGARWLAFTDADAVVAPEWLSAQLALGTEVVCGTVGVRDWGQDIEHSMRMRRHYDATYTDADGHQHIHGANLGVSAEAYRRAGGFQPMASNDDVALVRALQASGATIAWSAAPRVSTTAQRLFRVPSGFGATLRRIDAENRACAAEAPA
jgi:glycosyltransferase involved in cell wall biosynthesis